MPGVEVLSRSLVALGLGVERVEHREPVFVTVAGLLGDGSIADRGAIGARLS